MNKTKKMKFSWFGWTSALIGLILIAIFVFAALHSPFVGERKFTLIATPFATIGVCIPLFLLADKNGVNENMRIAIIAGMIFMLAIDISLLVDPSVFKQPSVYLWLGVIPYLSFGLVALFSSAQ